MAKRVDYEERFYVALKRITSYMTPAQLRQFGERHYGLHQHTEALEMAYENVIAEAKDALRGYKRKPQASLGVSTEVSFSTAASAAQEKS